MTNEDADKIYASVEIIPGLEAKIYDDTNIKSFLEEKKEELDLEYLEYLEGKKDIFGIYIAEFKKILLKVEELLWK